MSSKFVVLAAIDLNPGSSNVFEHACLMAASHPSGEVHVVTVAEPQVPMMVYPGLVPPPEPTGTETEATAQFCRDRMQAFHALYPDSRLPHVHVHTSIGAPANEIIWLAAHLDADWIVIATHGRRGLKRILLGSVAEKVMRLAGCPVMIMRDKNHNPEWKVPEIEPVCPNCAITRQETGGKQLWCDYHAEPHIVPHAVHYSYEGDRPLNAWEASTGT